MKIKELEELLSIPRSNIRFYEKEGLFTPERRDNNYREYTQSDIEDLQRIIVLRKMGLTVEEIKKLNIHELPFHQAIAGARKRLEDEIEQLNGSLRLVRQLEKEKVSMDEIDFVKHWDTICKSEKSGEEFVDICRDFLELERNAFDFMWKYAFFHDFKKSRANRGTAFACGILLLLCVLRGISNVLIWKESFWVGFLYPFGIALAGSIIILPIFLLSKKFPKAGAVAASILLAIIVFFFACIILLLL